MSKPADRFANPPGSPQRQGSKQEWRDFMLKMLLLSHKVKVPPEHVLSKEQAALGWQNTLGNKLQWLGHSAFRWQLNDTVILSDPLLTARASPFTFMGPKRFVKSPLAPKEARADIVLLTHNHYDHLDLRTLRHLPNKDSVQVIVPLGLRSLIQKAGLPNVIELDWHQSVVINEITITLLPAIHFSSRTLWDRNKSLWGGYLLQHTDQKYYLSGDTAYHPQVFKEIGRQYGPVDYALLAIGAYSPRNLMIATHVNPAEAVMIAQDIGARTLVGHHWGALRLTLEPVFEPPQLFVQAAQAAGYAKEDCWIMQIGQTRAF